MKLLKAPNLAVGHELVVKYIHKHCYKDQFGNPVIFPGENKQDTIEAKELCLEIDTPMARPRFIAPPILPFSEMYLNQYTQDLLYGTEADFVYDYHDRLVEHFNVNQLIYIVNKLRTSPATRRAQATTWDPQLDTIHDDVPCLQLIHCDIRNDKLNMKVLFRSEDMTLGLGPNMYGLTALQQSLADMVELPIGTYTHICFCPHLYIHRDADYIQNVLEIL